MYACATTPLDEVSFFYSASWLVEKVNDFPLKSAMWHTAFTFELSLSRQCNLITAYCVHDAPNSQTIRVCTES